MPALTFLAEDDVAGTGNEENLLFEVLHSLLSFSQL